MKCFRSAHLVALSFLALAAFTACGNSKDHSNQNAFNQSNFPEDQADVSPYSGMTDQQKYVGIWKSDFGDDEMLRISESSKTGGLILIGADIPVEGRGIFSESIRLIPNAKQAGAYTATFKLTEDLKSEFTVTVNLENAGTEKEILRYGYWVNGAAYGSGSVTPFRRMNIHTGGLTWNQKIRDLGMRELSKDKMSFGCLTEAEDIKEDTNALKNAFDRAISAHQAYCVGNILSQMKTPTDRVRAMESFGAYQFFESYPDADVYEELVKKSVLSSDDLKSGFSKVIDRLYGYSSAMVYPTRLPKDVSDEQSVVINKDGFNVELFDRMLDDNLKVTNVEDAMDALTLLPASTSLKLINLLKAQNGGNLPLTKNWLVHMIISSSNSSNRSAQDAMKVVDALIENGYPLSSNYADGSGNLGYELIENADVEMASEMKKRGIVSTADDVAHGRAYLARLRKEYGTQKTTEEKLLAFSKIESVKQILRNVR